MKNQFKTTTKGIRFFAFLFMGSLFANAQSGISINETSNTITSSTHAIGFADDTLKTTTLFKGSNANFTILGTGNTGLVLFGTTGLLQPLNLPNDSTKVLRGNGTFAAAVTFGPWATSGSNVFYTSGSVGIGTSSPAYLLDVIGSGHFSSYINTPHINFYNSLGSGIAFDGPNFTITSTSGSISFASGSLISIQNLTSTGKVSGNSLTANDSMVSPFIHSSRILPLGSDSNIRFGNSGFMFKPHRRGICLPDEILTSGGIISLDDSALMGKVWVGIGTTHPDAALNITSTGGPSCYPHTTTLMLSVTSPIDSTDVFTVDQNGNTFIPRGKLSIGINSADMPGSYRLYVKGGILTEHCRVAKDSTTDWSDYVFSNTYKLASLDSVEKYIKQNHHLQDVPSTAEVTKNGIDVAQMDAQLLKKIEELTLYVIQLQKDNAALKQEIEAKK